MHIEKNIYFGTRNYLYVIDTFWGRKHQFSPMSDTGYIGHTTGRVKTGWPTQNGLHLPYVLAIDDVVLVYLVFVVCL